MYVGGNANKLQSAVYRTCNYRGNLLFLQPQQQVRGVLLIILVENELIGLCRHHSINRTLYYGYQMGLSVLLQSMDEQEQHSSIQGHGMKVCPLHNFCNSTFKLYFFWPAYRLSVIQYFFKYYHALLYCFVVVYEVGIMYIPTSTFFFHHCQRI